MRRSSRCLVWMSAILGGAGCDRLADDPAGSVLNRDRVSVREPVLDEYVGTYRLASGAHFPVVREGERLLGGTPPHELFAQTTRQFSSNRIPGEFHFERSDRAGPIALRRRLGEQDWICERIDPNVIDDPTRRAAVGDDRLRLLVAGTGEPTVVLEDGIGNGIECQAEFQAELAKLSTVVAYDHAGTGGSDPGSAPRDARQIAGELRQALRSAGLKPPFLLIGASIGAEYIRVFAHEFPEDTAGLILLDPTPDWERLFEWAEVHAPARAPTYRRFALAGGAAMDRLMDVQEPGRRAEWSALEATREQAREAFPLPDVPVVQITGAGGREVSSEIDDKVRFFEDWLGEHLPRAKHVLAPNSGHAVTIGDRPLVLDEVRQMLVELRPGANGTEP